MCWQGEKGFLNLADYVLIILWFNKFYWLRKRKRGIPMEDKWGRRK